MLCLASSLMPSILPKQQEEVWDVTHTHFLLIGRSIGALMLRAVCLHSPPRQNTQDGQHIQNPLSLRVLHCLFALNSYMYLGSLLGIMRQPTLLVKEFVCPSVLCCRKRCIKYTALFKQRWGFVNVWWNVLHLRGMLLCVAQQKSTPPYIMYTVCVSLVCLCVHIWLCVCISICVSVCVFISAYEFLCVSLCVCMCTSSIVCVCVCVCVWCCCWHADRASGSRCTWESLRISLLAVPRGGVSRTLPAP